MERQLINNVKTSPITARGIFLVMQKLNAENRYELQNILYERRDVGIYGINKNAYNAAKNYNKYLEAGIIPTLCQCLANTE